MTRRRASAFLVVRVRLRLVSVIELVTARQRCAVREILVDLSHYISFNSYALSCEHELGRVSGDRTIGKGEQRKVRPDAGSNRNGGSLGAQGRVVAQDALAGIGRESIRTVRYAFNFPEFLIIGKEKGLVLFDRSARRAAELIALKPRLLRIKGIACIQSAVPQEFENSPMELVGS